VGQALQFGERGLKFCAMAQPVRFKATLAAILFGAGIVFLIGNNRTALWDRDEPWYAQCTREMVQTGDWVVPKFLGDWRMEKPPMVYWCQIAAVKLLGDSAEAVRFPSSVAVLGTAVLLGLMARRFVGPRRALWAVFIFCTAGVVIASAKFCITDAVMLFFVAIGQVCLGLLYAAHMRGKKPRRWIAPIFWIATGCAGLTKGPQALGMHVVTLIVLALLEVGGKYKSRAAWKSATRWWWTLEPLIGVPLLVAVVAPWLIMIHIRAPGFVEELIHKARLHSATSMEGHGQLPGYHALLSFGTYFPWSLLLPTTVLIAWRRRKLPQIRFAMAAVAGPWLLMEMVKTKLPFYILPAYPALAFLTADTLVRCMRGQFKELASKAFIIGVAVWALAAVAIGFSPWLILLMQKQLPLPRPAMAAFSAGAAIYAGIVMLRFCQKQYQRAAITMGVGMGIMISILYSMLFPHLQLIRISERMVYDMWRVGAVGREVPIAMIGYTEPSLSYYQGGGAKGVDDNYLEKTPEANWPRWVTIDSQIWDKTPVEIQNRFDMIAAEWGVNYSSAFKEQAVYLLEKREIGQ
jgi:4-amino-4-deoxy-L-arabinose transferase-like glycosyltransferase